MAAVCDAKWDLNGHHGDACLDCLQHPPPWPVNQAHSLDLLGLCNGHLLGFLILLQLILTQPLQGLECGQEVLALWVSIIT